MFSAPDADRFNHERGELLAKIKIALGSRAAEEMVYGEPSTGAESGFQQLTGIARQMVGRWGMSDKIGPLTVMPSEARGLLLPGASQVSPRTQEVIDERSAPIVEAAHNEVVALLTEKGAHLNGLAEARGGRER
jgi:cell division protease FtsH